MILVFVLLGFIIFILFIACLILFSTLKIRVQNLEVSNIPVKQNAKYNIIISLHLFNHIKWLKISFNENKVKKMLVKMPNLKVDFKKMEQDFKIEDLKAFTKLHPQISLLDLQAEIGVESPVVTAFMVAIISSIIAIILPHVAKTSSKYEYTITPIYQNKNLYKIGFNCIIELKMVHIINVIYILLKKGKRDKNERTTSNRKSYGYSYE